MANKKGAAPPEPTTEWQTITPAIAAKYLLCNTHNRPLNQRKVDAYALALKEGRWTSHHQGIAFDWNNTLIDGQHRLAAIVQTGVSLRIPVSRGLDPKTQLNIDQPHRRSAAQNLGLQGVPCPKQFAGFMNMIYVLLSMNNKVTLTSDQMLAIYDQIVPQWAWATGWCTQGKLQHAEIGGSLFFAYFTNPTKVTKFIELFQSGAGLAADSPVLQAYKMVYEGRGDVRFDRRTTSMRFLRFIRAHIEDERRVMRNLYATETTVNFFATHMPQGTILAEMAEEGRVRRIDPTPT